MNVFLTRGTGFIGKPLTRALLSRWRYRDARTMWLDALGGEIALLRTRGKESIVSRLRPADVS